MAESLESRLAALREKPVSADELEERLRKLQGGKHEKDFVRRAERFLGDEPRAFPPGATEEDILLARVQDELRLEEGNAVVDEARPARAAEAAWKPSDDDFEPPSEPSESEVEALMRRMALEPRNGQKDDDENVVDRNSDDSDSDDSDSESGSGSEDDED